MPGYDPAARRRAADPHDLRLAARGLRVRAPRSRGEGCGRGQPDRRRPARRRVQLVAPTSTDERIALAAERTDDWLYLVTVTGTTGGREGVSPALRGLVERARRLTDLPLYAGFGISTPEDATVAAEVADG